MQTLGTVASLAGGGPTVPCPGYWDEKPHSSGLALVLQSPGWSASSAGTPSAARVPGKPPQCPGASPSPRASGSSGKALCAPSLRPLRFCLQSQGCSRGGRKGPGLPCPPTGRGALFNEKHYVGSDKGPDGRGCCFLTSPWHSWSPSHNQVWPPQPPTPSFITHTPCCPPINFHSISRPPYSRFIHSHPNSAPLPARTLWEIPALATGIRNVVCGSVSHSVLKASYWHVLVTVETQERDQDNKDKSSLAGEPHGGDSKLVTSYGSQDDKDRARNKLAG